MDGAFSDQHEDRDSALLGCRGHGQALRRNDRALANEPQCSQLTLHARRCVLQAGKEFVWTARFTQRFDKNSRTAALKAPGSRIGPSWLTFGRTTCCAAGAHLLIASLINTKDICVFSPRMTSIGWV